MARGAAARLSHCAQSLPVTRRPLLHLLPWLIAGLAAVLGAAWLARQELTRQHEAFDTDARIAHRLLSQRVVQHDAVLATLTLWSPTDASERPEQRLPALYPQILRAERRPPAAQWAQDSLRLAERDARARRRPALGAVDLASGRYELVAAAGDGAYALQIDLGRTVPREEWPMAMADSPVRVTLELNGQSFVVQPGQAPAGPVAPAFGFDKRLASDSQPFVLRASTRVGWAALPWWRMGAWSAAMLLAAWAWQAWRRQLAARRRAEELLRLGQVARLNTLGELAAGMAHELNQPLTALLANTQAALRLVKAEPADLPQAQAAMVQAAQQARRAADVVGRLRRLVERPADAQATQAVALQDMARHTLELLEPECRRRGVQAALNVTEPATVRADPVALEQIVHNLVLNALQALESVPLERRRLWLDVTRDGAQGRLTVRDNGPAIAPELLPRVFEPFFSTRDGGLGLGLSLCQTLSTNMGGSLQATNGPDGAVFTLELPLQS